MNTMTLVYHGIMMWVASFQIVQAQVTELIPDSTVRAHWERVVACAGEQRDTSKTFEQIKFFERDSTYYQGSLIRGEWKADSIFLTKGLINDGWIVAHEMLHHALNGPPVPVDEPAGADTHVLAMGTFIGCGLAEFQKPKPGAMPLPAHQPGTHHYK